jgi:hypothetical protein
VFQLAWAHADVRKAATARCQERQDVDAHPAYLDPAVAAESAALDAGRLVVHAKCRAEDRDFLLAEDRGFRRAGVARLAAAVRWGAPVRWYARTHCQVRQPQVARQKVEYSREPRRLAGPALLQAVKQELQDEWVSARQAGRASQQLERPQALGLAP